MFPRKAVVIRIPRFVFWLINSLAKRRTVLRRGMQVEPHSHGFLAFYFVKHVAYLQSYAGRKSLPKQAIVVVPPNVVHGWLDVADEWQDGIVAHFHTGHAAHAAAAL